MTRVVFKAKTHMQIFNTIYIDSISLPDIQVLLYTSSPEYMAFLINSGIDEIVFEINPQENDALSFLELTR